MRVIKTLNLAIAAAIAATVLLGASSALADKPYLCKSSNLGECTEANAYASGDQLRAELQPGTKLEWVGTFPIKCQKSTITAELAQNPASEQGFQVLGKVKSFTLAECNLNEAPCTVEILQLPYEVHVEQSATDGNGVAWIGPQPPGLQPGAKITCETATGKKVCTFKANEDQPGGDEGKDSIKLSIVGNVGGSAANRVKIKLEEVFVKRTEGTLANCGNTAKWSATYDVVRKFTGQPPAENDIVNDPPGWITHEPDS
jgi:hypothetical protein